MLWNSSTDSHGKGIAIIDNQVCFGCDKCGALDARMDHVVDNSHRSFENAADDALLSPDLSFFQLTIGNETCQFRARAGATWRAVVGVAGTEYKILTIHAGKL